MSQLRLSLATLSIAAATAVSAAAQVGSAGGPSVTPSRPTPAITKRTSAPKATKPPGGYTIAQFLSPSSPLEVSAAKKADKVAWVSYERGMRNVYVAAAPDFKATRITKFMDDDGIDVGSVRLSDDGSTAIFIRGSGQNRVG
ncbi:MAG: hypothetical protein ACREPM_23945, partial [Gemmatimonadaceae bacterium]